MVLLVEGKSLGYNYTSSAGRREKSGMVLMVLLVGEKSLGWLLWFCWLTRKVWDGSYGSAGWREKSGMVIMVMLVGEKSLGW
jgi:hypothetical protein